MAVIYLPFTFKDSLFRFYCLIVYYNKCVIIKEVGYNVCTNFAHSKTFNHYFGDFCLSDLLRAIGNDRKYNCILWYYCNRHHGSVLHFVLVCNMFHYNLYNLKIKFTARLELISSTCELKLTQILLCHFFF